MPQQMGVIGMDDQKLAEKALDLVRSHRLLAELVVLLAQPEYAKRHGADILHEQLAIDLGRILSDGRSRCVKAVLHADLAPSQRAIMRVIVDARHPRPSKAKAQPA